MSESKHTPGPWKVIKPGHHHAAKTRYRCVQIGKDENYSTLEMFPADAERIVACVNACEGINPEAVPELIEAARAFEPVIRRNLYPTPDNPNSDWAKASRLFAAITKATGGETDR